MIFDIENWLWKSEFRYLHGQISNRPLICQRPFTVRKCYLPFNKARVWGTSCWKILKCYLIYIPSSIQIHYWRPIWSKISNIWADTFQNKSTWSLLLTFGYITLLRQWGKPVRIPNYVCELSFSNFWLIFLTKAKFSYRFPFFSALNQFQNSSTIAGQSGHRSAKFGADTSQTKVDLVSETYFRT